MAQRRPPKGVDSKGKVRWVARYKDPSGKGRSKDFAREKDAKNFEAEMKLAVRKRTWIDPDLQDITVGELYDEWADRPLRQSTSDGYAQTGKNLGDLRNYPIYSLTSADVDAWYRQLTTGRPWISPTDTGLQSSTAREHVARLSAAINGAVDREIIHRNPVKIPRRANTGGDPVLLSAIPSEEDIVTIVNRAEHGGYRYTRTVGAKEKKHTVTSTARPNRVLADLIITAVTTGARVSELCGLTVGDVDFLRRRIRVELQAPQWGQGRVPTKTPRSVRVIPVADDLLTILSPHCDGCRPGDRLFRTRGGGSWHATSAGIALARIIEDTEMEWTFHSFRHLYASRLVGSGVNVRSVQSTLGHSDASTTLRTYTHLWGDAEDETRSAISGVAGAIRGRFLADGQNMGKGASGSGLHVV